MIVQRIKRTWTPWEYLDSLVCSDRGPEHNETWMTERLQKQYPGNYTVKKIEGFITTYNLVFESPADELMFKLRWS